MKTTKQILTVIALLGLAGSFTMADPMGTAFTFQGRMTAGGSVANGPYDLKFLLYDAQNAGTQIGPALTNSPVCVSNGLFTVTLDFGAGVFAGSPRWLAIGVRTNGSAGAFSTLGGRQPVTPSPYAIYAVDALTAASAMTAGAVPWSGLTGLPTGFADGVDNDTLYSAGTGLSLTGTNFGLNTNYTDSLYWKRGGNAGTTAGTNFVGTTDSQPLEFKVSNTRALRLELKSVGLPNVIGGAPNNSIETYASAIGGGSQNTIQTGADSSTVGGGNFNTIQTNAYYSTIGGGGINTIETKARASVIGGGTYNTIQTNAVNSTIGGGYGNTNAAGYSVIPGGYGNTIETGAFYSTVGGGNLHTIQTNATCSTIAGGHVNTIHPSAQDSTIGGGSYNTNTRSYATIPGGSLNEAGWYGFAAGYRAKSRHMGAFVWADYGEVDFASAANNEFAVRAGGGARFETAGKGLTVDGQEVLSGQVAPGQLAPNSVTAGTITNDAVGSAQIANGSIQAADVNASTFSNMFWKADGNAGTTAGTHFVGTTDSQPLEFKVNNVRALRLEWAVGGQANVIAGAANNSIGTFGSTIGGGYQNTIETNAYFSVIGGGAVNTIQTNSATSTIGGGSGNTIQTHAPGSTIGGGAQHTIASGAYQSTIDGGVANRIQNNAHESTIGGGMSNTIQTNADSSTIGGGVGNTNTGSYSTIPGGCLNEASSYGFAAGYRAKARHQGTFVWADSSSADFASTANNQFLIRAAGNVGINKNNPASALDVAGTVTATNFSGSGANLTGIPAAGLADGAVTSAKILDGTISANDLADSAVTSAKILDSTITAADLADASVTAAKIADGAVTSAKITDGTITAADLAANSVTTAKIADSAVTSAKIADGTLTTADLADSSVTTAKIADSAVSSAKIADLTILATDLADSSVTAAKLAPGAVGTSALADSAMTSAKIADLTITSADLSDSSVTSAKIANGTVATADLADAAVSSAKLANDSASLAKVSAGSMAVSGGYVGIGTASPASPLDLTSSKQMDVGSDGILNIGTLPGRRITIDGDDIQAKNGTASSMLYLNYYGGDVWVCGTSGTSSDLMGVGRSPTANKLEVEGNASKTTAGGWVANSDARIKTAVATVTNALATLLRVRPVSFQYTEAYRAEHPSIEDRPYLNVIAQEFQQIFPDYVHSSGEFLPDGDQILQVDTYPLTIYSVAAIQELERKVEAETASLRAEIRSKDAELQALKQDIAELREAVRQLAAAK
jgi:hypothetical protein